jgi:chemotaxis methyl-accepting protein methylase
VIPLSQIGHLLELKMDKSVAVQDSAALDLLLEKVYRDGGYDFREYRRGTVTRRLERRLLATGTSTYTEYRRFLDSHPEEYLKLAEDLTIKTSGFFRSQLAFQRLAELVLPELIDRKASRREHRLRFWSVACACGEEPYSIAISLAEFLGHRLRDYDILIYATDISRQALRKAKDGEYSLQEVACLPTDIRDGYFARQDETALIKDEIRSMVHFSRFDLTSTDAPPFKGLDCVICCNVLIYLQRTLQERVLRMLYDSLSNPGYLILGEVETPAGNLNSKLECLDGKARIYRKAELVRI